MIVTFIGDADYIEQDGHREQIVSVLEEHVGDRISQIFFDGVGRFDLFGLICGREFQKTHPNTALTVVTPYFGVKLDPKQIALYQTLYDHILNPPLEPLAREEALVQRRAWMTDESDLIILYLTSADEEAQRMLNDAKQRGKQIVNLAKNLPSYAH